ncbi:MAG: hypothetical protein WCK41_09785 [Actinomycetes bacterium]
MTTSWRKIIMWSLVGTTFAVVLILANLALTFDTLGGLVVAGPTEPSAPIIEHDIPGYPTTEAGEHDGKFFYVMAREPMHLHSVAAGLDRPRYRLQRILFPWLVWILHPTGGGVGLVWAMFAVGVLGIFAGSVASGALSMHLRGPPWPAVAFGLMTGSLVSLRISTPDPLATALVFWALWFLLRKRLGWALLLGVAAALTKETTVLFLIGYAMWRRDRDSLIAVAVPIVAAGSWWLWLRSQFPEVGNQVTEIVTPFSGWAHAIDFWSRGYEPLGWLSFGIAIGVGIAALIKGRLRHPFGWAILINLLMFIVLSTSAIAPERSAGRTTMGELMLAIIVLATARNLPEGLRGRPDGASEQVSVPNEDAGAVGKRSG